MADQTDLPESARQLAATLNENRAIVHTRREHQVASRLDTTGYRDAILRIRDESTTRRVERREARRDRRDQAAAARQARREARRDRAEARRLAALHRDASVSGERARVAVAIRGSVEARRRRIDRLRGATLKVGLPVLLAFAAWSTVGVHAGVTGLLAAATGSAWWWGAWTIEPAIIAIVAGVIVARAILRSAGGDVDWRAHVAHWGALTTSIVLNLAGHWPTAFAATEITQAVAHSIGPVGAALTAWLIGVMDDYVTAARPDVDNGRPVPTLAELGINTTTPAPPALKVPARPLTSAQPERPASGNTERSTNEPRAHLRDADYERLLSAQPADDETPIEPPAAHRRERPVNSSTAERRSLVAQLLEENPDMTGPEIADAVGARLGQPVSVATAKRDRAAVQKEQG